MRLDVECHGQEKLINEMTLDPLTRMIGYAISIYGESHMVDSHI